MNDDDDHDDDDDDDEDDDADEGLEAPSNTMAPQHELLHQFLRIVGQKQTVVFLLMSYSTLGGDKIKSGTLTCLHLKS